MLSTFERRWKEEVLKLEKDYSGDEMCHDVEIKMGHRLALAGPMIDSYLKQIGRSFMHKLSRSKATGLASPVTLFIPWGIMKYICGMCGAYSCRMKSVQKVINITIENMSSANKLFDPTRFDGTNFLVKRCFRKVLDEVTNKRTIKVHGSAEVVVTKNTPISLDYTFKTETLRINFYIQRYTNEGFVVDASLQALMNRTCEQEEASNTHV